MLQTRYHLDFKTENTLLFAGSGEEIERLYSFFLEWNGEELDLIKYDAGTPADPETAFPWSKIVGTLGTLTAKRIGPWSLLPDLCVTNPGLCGPEQNIVLKKW